MRYGRSRVVIALFAICLYGSAAFGQPVGGVHQVGIPAAEMDFVSAAQGSSQWCWAAAIQMVLRYHGVSITQQQIVARSYGTDPWGNLPNWSGSFGIITRNLNNWSIDNYGQEYAVGAVFGWGAPPAAVLIEELHNGRPMIISYRDSPVSAHAVVVTAATFSRSGLIHSIVVRDPWPTPANVLNKGRIEYDGSALAAAIQAHWRISVVRARPRLGQRLREHGVQLAALPATLPRL